MSAANYIPLVRELVELGMLIADRVRARRARRKEKRAAEERLRTWRERRDEFVRRVEDLDRALKSLPNGPARRKLEKARAELIGRINKLQELKPK